MNGEHGQLTRPTRDEVTRGERTFCLLTSAEAACEFSLSESDTASLPAVRRVPMLAFESSATFLLASLEPAAEYCCAVSET